MKKTYTGIITLFVLTFSLFSCKNQSEPASRDGFLIKNVTLIDGNGGDPERNKDILILGDTIAEIGNNLDSSGVEVIHANGKTLMPALISAHVHVGTLKGTATKSEYYTRENILAQLEKYASYGVLNILSLGTDRPLLFESGIRDSSVAGDLPGARLQSAGYGFGVPKGAPPVGFAMDMVFRPENPEQVTQQMDSLVKVKPSAVKIWVDDFGGQYPKMNPAVYRAVIQEAHKNELRVASHAYYLSDAAKLITFDVDIIAHSVRDSVFSDSLITVMKGKNIVYIPTLTLDEFSFIYARTPDWLDDNFFKASLEPGVYEMITAEKYRNDIKNSASYTKNEKALQIAMQNLKKLYDAGILIALGTDSGATPVRAQGFSEHRELELMVQAGLTPLQAITVATKNAAKVLRLDKQFGTIEKGKIADFIIVEGNPANNIKDTRNIQAVYKAGKIVNIMKPVN